MSRLTSLQPDNATGQAAELFGAIKRVMGKVPNAYQVIGIAPEILAQALQHNATLAKSNLSKRELEAINLAVSETSGCDYCLAAHTLTGKMAGYTLEQTQALRQGAYPEEAHIDALVKFVKTLVTTHGTLPEETVTQFRAAGFSDRQVVEVISAVSAILFTNMINRVNDTLVDFPKVN
ncbi:alkylhydroperoxidase [[Pantoea] beijingensis]|uniref:Alkylhydroperoxidase n=1 Tax=[Pantoea] beijingensis TaxID=1324864 RepID=A0A443I922_9GAMM|nr:MULTISPECIES: carboxymuconolactone decarboxylase family protein [Erwiniaceae]RWR00582.1 alkylhydroperoxidase [[Pantoea] beijingensis]